MMPRYGTPPNHSKARRWQPSQVATVFVEHHLGVLVTRVAQRHHEDPGVQRFAGVRMRDDRSGPEIDLRIRSGQFSEEMRCISCPTIDTMLLATRYPLPATRYLFATT